MSDRVSGNGQATGLPPPGTGRRRSLVFLIALLVGLPLAFVIREALDDGWREVTSSTGLGVRDVVYLHGIRTFIVDGDPVVALSARSPRLGDHIAYCPDGDVFAALGHGERFHRDGTYRSGPGGLDMTRFGARIQDGTVEINLDRVTVDRTPIETAPLENEFTGICNFEDWSEMRPGFLEREPA